MAISSFRIANDCRSRSWKPESSRPPDAAPQLFNPFGDQAADATALGDQIVQRDTGGRVVRPQRVEPFERFVRRVVHQPAAQRAADLGLDLPLAGDLDLVPVQ